MSFYAKEQPAFRETARASAGIEVKEANTETKGSPARQINDESQRQISDAELEKYGQIELPKSELKELHITVILEPTEKAKKGLEPKGTDFVFDCAYILDT